MTRLGAGTIGPLTTDSVLEGIADGRVPIDTSARAVGEREARRLLEIPVFEAAARSARPLGPPPEPFEGLVETEHERRAQLREERAELRRREAGARLRRMTAPLGQPHAAWLVTVGALLGAVIGAAFTALVLPRDRPALLAHAGRSIDGAALRATTLGLARPAIPTPPPPIPAPAVEPTPSASVTAAASAEPPPTRPARPGSGNVAPSFSIDPLNAPLTPPLGPPRTP